MRFADSGGYICRRMFGAALGAALFLPDAASGQIAEVYPVPSSVRTRITVTSVVLGATVGGLRAWSTRRPVRRGLLLGAGAGFTTAFGRQITATRRPFAGVIGRTVHDVGLGLGSAAVDSQFTLPLHVGPLVARWTPAARTWPLVRVNATGLLYATVLAAESNTRVDWKATLWSGAVAIQPRYAFGSGPSRASAAPGTIRLAPFSNVCGLTSSGASACRIDLAHETVHIQQIDMLHEWIGQPLEDAMIMRRLRRHRVFRHIELGAVGAMSVAGLERLRSYDTRWSEYEASWLVSGRGPFPQP